MAQSVNKVFLIGRAGKEPEIIDLEGGSRIVKFTLATDKSWRSKQSGERMSEVTWHNIVVFDNRLGQIVERNVRKGSHMVVEGEIRNRTYEKDGVKHYVSEVTVPAFSGSITLLDRQSGAGKPYQPRKPTGTDQKGNERWGEGEDDIPF